MNLDLIQLFECSSQLSSAQLPAPERQTDGYTGIICSRYRSHFLVASLACPSILDSHHKPALSAMLCPLLLSLQYLFKLKRSIGLMKKPTTTPEKRYSIAPICKTTFKLVELARTYSSFLSLYRSCLLHFLCFSFLVEKEPCPSVPAVGEKRLHFPPRLLPPRPHPSPLPPVGISLLSVLYLFAWRGDC